jgi:hypothetical protein
VNKDDSTGTALRDMWSAAVSDISGNTFAASVSPDFVLEGSIFMQPITGRDSAFAALRASSGIYDSLQFTREPPGNGRLYLEWEGLALNEKLAGVTVLSLDAKGKISGAAIHCRPLGAAIAFSEEMRHRLTNVVDPTHFLSELTPQNSRGAHDD